MFQIDQTVFQLIHNLSGKNPTLDAVGVFFAERFEYIVLLSLAPFVLVYSKKYWPAIWRALLAAVFSRLVIAEIIRFLWARPRPFIVENFTPLVQENPYNSFPSGHATFYFALATVIYLYDRKVGIIFLLAAFLISVGRIFAGVHWPTDIMGGALIGGICGWIVWRLLKGKAK